MSADAPLIDVQSLAVVRGDRRLIASLTLRLLPGELVHLRGPNGVGKTSLLETLAGIRRTEGPAATVPAGPFHFIGHLNGHTRTLDVLENLSLAARLLGAPPDAVEGALRAAGLWARRFRRVETLSAGQGRRLALARLLLVRRPLWLLDEPFASLDSAGLAWLEALLAGHLADGGGVLLSSHQPIGASLGRARELELHG